MKYFTTWGLFSFTQLAYGVNNSAKRDQILKLLSRIETLEGQTEKPHENIDREGYFQRLGFHIGTNSEKGISYGFTVINIALATLMLAMNILSEEQESEKVYGFKTDSYSKAAYALGLLSSLGAIGEQILKTYNLDGYIESLEQRRDYLLDILISRVAVAPPPVLQTSNAISSLAALPAVNIAMSELPRFPKPTLEELGSDLEREHFKY